MTCVKQEMRSWKFEPDTCKRLIQNVVVQTVRDAYSLNRHNRLEGITGFDPASVPLRKQQMKTWTKSDRFEFWIAMLDIDSGFAAQTLQALIDGTAEVPSEFFRSDKK